MRKFLLIALAIVAALYAIGATNSGETVGFWLAPALLVLVLVLIVRRIFRRKR